MSADDILTWREAEDAMERGERVDIRCDGVWRPARVYGGALQVLAPPRGGGTATWFEPTWALSALRASEWRRVPKAVRVHELPQLWSGVTGGAWSLRLEMIQQLERCLLEDDIVSLAGVTLDDLREVFHQGSDESETLAFARVLECLRARSRR